MIALRKTALTLHAMSPADRAWLLDRLPAAHRQPLRDMLEELVSLGISGDPGFVTQLLSEDHAPNEGRALTGCSAETFWRALDREPLAVQAACLQALSLDDRGAVLRCVSTSRRTALNQALAAPSLWPERLRLAVYAKVLGVAQASEGSRSP